MFSRHGLPYTIRSDNGPQFTSKVFEQYLNDNDVKHRKTTPLHPAANGEVERQNRSLVKRIRIAQAESLDWKKEIRKYLVAYRTKPHGITGISPSELMFKRKLRTKIPDIKQNCEEERDVHCEEEIRDRDIILKDRNKLYIDTKRKALKSELSVGDNVLVKQSQQNKMCTPFCTLRINSSKSLEINVLFNLQRVCSIRGIVHTLESTMNLRIIPKSITKCLKWRES